ncbi:MAG TPA: galactokinase [Candidatus Angelobacter sp.]|jgi:galactokinase|nr:galactokinase [Candidatus Angelobacter sp.]
MNLGVTPAISSPSPGDVARSTDVRNRFRTLYGENCLLYRAPGRINLIGEHTDYNDGFVMPAAINFYCWVAISMAKGRAVEVYSTNFNEHRSFDLDRPEPLEDWSDYVQGVALMLQRSEHPLQGAKMLVSSEVPIGSGLSSSAALEVAAGLAFLGRSNARDDHNQLALACQRAENEFVGARCGIMDQFIACNGQSGRLLMLDCRSLESRLLPIPENVRLVICNSMVRHAIATGEYNLRRSQCEEGVRLLARVRPGIRALRDVTRDELEQLANSLPPEILKRCRHVISENQRVLEAATTLEQCDLKKLRSLMAASHESLRDDYQVSCPELDLLVNLANPIEGVYGARMTGGGFGGCTINLVAVEAVSSFQDQISAQYRQHTGIVPEIYVSTASEGASRWDALS